MEEWLLKMVVIGVNGSALLFIDTESYVTGKRKKEKSHGPNL